MLFAYDSWYRSRLHNTGKRVVSTDRVVQKSNPNAIRNRRKDAKRILEASRVLQCYALCVVLQENHSHSNQQNFANRFRYYKNRKAAYCVVEAVQHLGSHRRAPLQQAYLHYRWNCQPGPSIKTEQPIEFAKQGSSDGI